MNAIVKWRPQLDSVYCMDALTLMHQCEAQSIDAIITDLPYGTTACTWDTIIPFEPLWAAVKHCLKPRGVFVTTASQPFTSALVMSNPAWFRYEWVWDKVAPVNFGNVKREPLKRHENVLIFSENHELYIPQLIANVSIPFGRKSKSVSGAYGSFGSNYNVGVGYPQSILRFMRPNNLTGGGLHPTQKPVALYEYLIRTYTQPGDLVLDPCCGSGTTAIAARNTKRRFIAGDTDPDYCEIARIRLNGTGIDMLNRKEPATLQPKQVGEYEIVPLFQEAAGE